MYNLSDRQKFLLLSIYQEKGIGINKFKVFLNSFSNVPEIFIGDIENPKLSQKCLSYLNSKTDIEIQNRALELANLVSSSCKMITIWDDQYPDTLRNTFIPPFFLFYKGDISLLSQTDSCVSIVGTRNPSDYGQNLAIKTSKSLAEQDYIVVSGMAFGIDKIAHQSTFGIGKTIAVSPGGVEAAYPSSNTNVYNRIVEEGLIISEYIPGTKPNKGSFLARNRIIAGLSRATIIVEAGEKSGSLITARHAFEENRDVLVFPGDATRKSFAGSNRLIRDNKGILVSSTQDIFTELGVNTLQNNEKYTKLSEEEKSIVEILEKQPSTIEQLAKKLAKEFNVMITLCSNLEIKSVIKRDSIGRYILS